MKYDHSNKIGNRGDVVKHAVLAAVVDRLLQDDDKPFTYIETHTGRSEYILPEGGEWRKGIRKFWKRVRDVVPGTLNPYVDHALANNITTAQRYPGSSGLVFRMAQAKGAMFRFVLYETDSLAAADLVRYYHPWPEVTVVRSDGLQGILGIDEASLVLLDPPDLGEHERIKAAMEHLSNRETPFLCWIPWDRRTSGEDEAAALYENLEQYGPIHVSWENDAETGFIGCHVVLAPASLCTLGQDVVSEVCNHMGWNCEWAELASG